MNFIRRSHSWITLAFVAILAMAATPGFAFACYCGTSAARPSCQQSCHHSTAATEPASHHDHCHGDADEDADGDAAPVITSPSATVAPHQGSQADTSVRTVRAPHTHDCCTCQVNEAAPFAATESPTLLPQLVHVVGALPAQACSLALPSSPTLGFIEYRAGPANNPVNPALPSRAPPVN